MYIKGSINNEVRKFRNSSGSTLTQKSIRVGILIERPLSVTDLFDLFDFVHEWSKFNIRPTAYILGLGGATQAVRLNV